MSVWLTIPSARENGGTAPLWRSRGYKVALWRDQSSAPVDGADIVLTARGAYPGYAVAVNTLAKEVLRRDPECNWVVTGGDDTEPDPHEPEEVARQCEDHFGGTFGVMQPIGDRWGGVERICGSPWMGREFCERMYGGTGPLWPDYRHMFVDEELFEVSRITGALWQRGDLVHRHNHFCRQGDSVDWAKGLQEMPAFLREANSQEHWQKFGSLFRARKAAGFPGHEPLPVGCSCAA